MKKITVWERYDVENKVWKHNHISDDHINSEKPIGDIQQTKLWSKYVWKSTEAYLDNNYKVING